MHAVYIHMRLGPVRTTLDYFFGSLDRLDYRVAKMVIIILIISG